MKENKLDIITKVFEGKEIRSIWDKKKEDYYFSVVDVIGALTDSPNPRNYWKVLKHRLVLEGNETVTNCNQLKMKSRDGKFYNTDVLDTEGIFRLIQSIPSKNAEPFKLWLAKLGRQEVDNVFDPSKGIDKMINYYLKKGYTLEWIEARIKAILNRKKLTNTWKNHGIEKEYEYAILTNEIYKTWSGMSAEDYKEFKGIKKENLRDNMTDIEVVLTEIGEIATRELTKKYKPNGLKENKNIAKKGGMIAKNTRNNFEVELQQNVITKNNNLDNYIDFKY